MSRKNLIVVVLVVTALAGCQSTQDALNRNIGEPKDRLELVLGSIDLARQITAFGVYLIDHAEQEARLLGNLEAFEQAVKTDSTIVAYRDGYLLVLRPLPEDLQPYPRLTYGAARNTKFQLWATPGGNSGVETSSREIWRSDLIRDIQAAHIRGQSNPLEVLIRAFVNG